MSTSSNGRLILEAFEVTRSRICSGVANETEDPAVSAETRHVQRVEQHPPAGRDNESAPESEFGGEFAVDVPERLLAPPGEDLRDRSVSLLDDGVGIDEGEPELPGQ